MEDNRVRYQAVEERAGYQAIWGDHRGSIARTVDTAGIVPHRAGPLSVRGPQSTVKARFFWRTLTGSLRGEKVPCSSYG